jgi:hypothetical protein
VGGVPNTFWNSATYSGTAAMRAVAVAGSALICTRHAASTCASSVGARPSR